MKIALVDLNTQYKETKAEIDNAIKKVINSARFIKGQELDLFEREFAKYCNSKYCVGVNSGTDALILGIRALGFSPGDEIILPVNTFFATAVGVVENMLKPVFVDIDGSDYGINIEDLKRKITKKTKAVIAVHLYGQPDKLTEIKKIIKQVKKKIFLIEDACQAHGAFYRKRRVGTFGVFSAFSFYPGKNLGAYGDGGAVITNNRYIEKKIKLLREYGEAKKYYHEEFGINSRLDAIQAAILRIKLKHLDSWNKNRQKHAKYYSSKLNNNLPSIVTPGEYSYRKSVYHLYVIQVKRRNQLIEYLNKEGIQSLIHYPIPLHLQNAFRFLKHKKGDFPTAEQVVSNIISLPMYPELKKSQIDYIVNKLIDFYN